MAAHSRAPLHLGHHPSCGERKAAWVQDANSRTQLLGKAFAPAEAQPKGLDKATTAHTSLCKANRKENAKGTVPVALHCRAVQK